MEKFIIDQEYLEEINKARRELRTLILKNKCAPLMLRLAWHEAGTYDPESKIKGGPNGSIRSEQVLKRQENMGLEQAVHFCEEVMAKLRKVSYADLYQLAGVVAVEVTGGPTIDFLPGRTDSDEPPQEGRLPNPNEKGVSHLRDIFITRMGLNDQDIVALFGGRIMGKSQRKNSDNEGQCTEDHLKFDNSYFVIKLKFHITLNRELLKKGAPSCRLPIDTALIEDRNFRKYVEQYAKDEDAFFKDYAVAHKKLSELGCNLKNPFMILKETPQKLKLIKPKLVIQIVIVSTVILGYLRKRKNNQLKK
ncbi:L-ascorbate peroxidase 5, peroxisomal, partial [Mucuna pruriens]